MDDRGSVYVKALIFLLIVGILIASGPLVYATAISSSVSYSSDSTYIYAELTIKMPQNNYDGSCVDLSTVYIQRIGYTEKVFADPNYKVIWGSGGGSKLKVRFDRATVASTFNLQTDLYNMLTAGQLFSKYGAYDFAAVNILQYP